MTRSETAQPSIRFLIRQLNLGGAQRQIVELVKGLSSSGFKVEVVTFYDGGPFAELLEQSLPGCHRSLKKKSRWDLGFVFRLRSMLRVDPTNVLATFFETGNVLGAILAPRNTRCIWNIRRSTVEERGFAHRILIIIENLLAFRPARIICNSTAGYALSKQRGFPEEKLVVIENGVDPRRFQFNPKAGNRVRELHGIRSDAHVITLPARLDPVKNHPLFFKAAGILAQRNAKAVFLCVGGGDAAYTQRLRESAEAIALGKRLIFIDTQNDMAAVYSASDLVTLTSHNEGFPNVLVEALACGVPCVTVDVGDARSIVQEFGRVVPVDSAEALAAGWSDILDQGRAAYAEHAVESCLERYSMDRLVVRFRELIQNLNSEQAHCNG